MKQTLTPAKLRELRQIKGVSQAQLARDLELQRSYISQFEHGKYIFDEGDLMRMKVYLEDEDTVDEVDSELELDSSLDPIIRDGFLVPGGFSEEEIEFRCDAIQACLDSFARLTLKDIPRGIVFGVDDEELAEMQLQAGLVAMRALNHIQELQGRNIFSQDNLGTFGENLRDLM